MFKTTKSKIALGFIIFGIIAAILMLTNKNAASIGQSLLVGGIFAAIGAVMLIIKKKPQPMVTVNIVKTSVNKPKELPDFTPLPIDRNYTKIDKPSERQLAYAKDLGIEGLDSHYFIEVSQMISRVEKGDYERPNVGLARYAQSVNDTVTPYIGADAVIGFIRSSLSASEKIAFYTYAVYCSLLNKELDDIRTAPHYDKFIEFGKLKENNEKFIKSIDDRPNSDFYKPSKKTIAYTEAFEFLKTIL